jgi:VanZ family protein
MTMAAIVRWLFVVCWMGVIFTLSSIPSLQVPFAHVYDFALRKLAHIGEYAVLTVLLWWALRAYTRDSARAWLLAALAAVLYGISDEWHQSMVAGRSGTFRDVGVDALGIAASYALTQHLPHRPIASTRQCPRCDATRLHRSRRRGHVERCSRVVRLAPFRCDVCSYRFWRFTRRGR